MQFISMRVQEANLRLDGMKESENPALVYVKPTNENNEQTAPSAVVRTRPMFGFILYRVKQATSDISTENLIDIVQQARYKLDSLVKNLNDSPITNQTVAQPGITKWKSEETFDEFDAGVHGITFNFDWPIIDLLACNN